ncbi:MAG: hypothetical protein WD081_03090 [Gammaproteobacteria bacterium]
MSKLTRVTELFRRAGAREAAVSLGLMAAARTLNLRVLQIVSIARGRLEPDYLKLAPEFEAGFVDEAQLVPYVVANPDLEMTPGFVRDAFSRGDLCYAITCGGEIASYGWYSNRPTEMFDGLTFHFDRSFTYMYKGYTRPEFRGKRLHAVGMSRALDAVASRGFRGLVSFVDRSNVSSLKSVYRMGYERVAKIAIFPVNGSHRIVRLGGSPALEVSVQSGAFAV